MSNEKEKSKKRNVSELLKEASKDLGYPRNCIGCTHFGCATIGKGQERRMIIVCFIAEDKEADDETRNDAADHMMTDAGVNCPYYIMLEPDDLDLADGTKGVRQIGVTFNYCEEELGDEEEQEEEEDE